MVLAKGFPSDKYHRMRRAISQRACSDRPPRRLPGGGLVNVVALCQTWAVGNIPAIYTCDQAGVYERLEIAPCEMAIKLWKFSRVGTEVSLKCTR